MRSCSTPRAPGAAVPGHPLGCPGKGVIPFPQPSCPPWGQLYARVPSVVSRCSAWDAFPACQEGGLVSPCWLYPGLQHPGLRPGRFVSSGHAGDGLLAVLGLPPCCWQPWALSRGFVSSPGRDLVAAELAGRRSASRCWWFCCGWGQLRGWSRPVPPAGSRTGRTRGSLESGLTPPVTAEWRGVSLGHAAALLRSPSRVAAAGPAVQAPLAVVPALGRAAARRFRARSGGRPRRRPTPRPRREPPALPAPGLEAAGRVPAGRSAPSGRWRGKGPVLKPHR